MYKFAAKEKIPLDTSIPEAQPSIIIPSNVPIYPATGLYPNIDHVNSARSMPSNLGPSHTPDIPGYADAGSAWPIYSSALPVVSGYGGTSRSEELTIKVLCPSNKLGRVIGKGGSSIRSIRQETGARIEVEDRKASHNECVVTVISMEVVPHLLDIWWKQYFFLVPFVNLFILLSYKLKFIYVGSGCMMLCHSTST